MPVVQIRNAGTPRDRCYQLCHSFWSHLSYLLECSPDAGWQEVLHGCKKLIASWSTNMTPATTRAIVATTADKESIVHDLYVYMSLLLTMNAIMLLIPFLRWNTQGVR